MNYLGIELNVKNIPELDRDFIPMGPWMIEYEKVKKAEVGATTISSGSYLNGFNGPNFDLG